MSKIKICGLKSETDINFANIAKPDYTGFIFAGVKRKIDFSAASKFRCLLNNEIKSVGVFVNDKIENIVNLYKNRIINLVQLHGDENETYIRKLKQQIKIPIIKAVKVKDKILNTETEADFILFDSEYGGSGKVFDWGLLKKYKKPFFLAGGLNKNNIETAVKKINPYCVDLSSGIETGGVKDLNKIIEIIKIVRSIK